jgi:hypothetical protein
VHNLCRRIYGTNPDHSEDKLNDISQKLDQISFAVNKITSPLPHLQGSTSAAHTALTSHITPKSYTDSPAEEAASNDDSTSELDGDVTLTTQATFATNFLEQVVNSNKRSNQPSEIEKSLDALRKVLTARNADNGDPGLVDTQRILSPTSQGGYQLPPMHLAMMAIQRLRGESLK